MKHPLSVLLGAAILAACAPRSPEPEVEVIGFPDSSRAVTDFVLAKAAASRVPPPSKVASRSVEGVPAHPRITFVYMSDRHWCGSGGCTLLVLVPGETGLTEIGQVTLVHPPVIALDTQTNGMPDLAVSVRGDNPGDGRKVVILAFDGRTYASNPTVPPARSASPDQIDGEIAISEADVALASHR